MKSRGAPPPPGAAPAVSREIVNIVKKKLSAPSSAPPDSMKSMSRPTKYGHNEDDDDEDDMDVGEIEEKINGKKDYRNNSKMDHSRTSPENDNIRTVDRSWDNDDRSDERQFQQPRRTPTRRLQNENDDDDDDERSLDDYESDHSGFGKGGGKNSYQKERSDRDDRILSAPSAHTSYPPTRSEAKNSDRDRDDRRTPSSGTKGGASRPAKAVTYNFQPLLKATYRELRSFVLSPCEVGVTTKCYIERTRGGGNMFAPIYSLCADLEDGTGRELLVCRKVLQSMSSHYVFSLKAGDLFRKRDQRSRLFLGKLRSTSSSEYILYDNGMVRSTSDRDSEYQSNVDDDEEEDDEKDNKGDSKDEVSLFRKELAVIYFNTKKRPAPLGVRGSEICIPTRRHGGESTQDRKAEAKDSSGGHAGQSLQNPFQIIRNESKQNQLYAKKCYIMHERTSRYDPLSSCLVDFKGRANMASVKNFQLVESYVTDGDAKKSQEIDSEREYILQVGKTTVDCFNMDYRYPLSMLQAFAIAIARLDAKLSW